MSINQSVQLITLVDGLRPSKQVEKTNDEVVAVVERAYSGLRVKLGIVDDGEGEGGGMYVDRYAVDG